MKILRISFADNSSADFEVGDNFMLPFVMDGVLRTQIGQVEVAYNWRFITNIILAPADVLLPQKPTPEESTAAPSVTLPPEGHAEGP
jgi:hypothetical protein